MLHLDAAKKSWNVQMTESPEITSNQVQEKKRKKNEERKTGNRTVAADAMRCAAPIGWLKVSSKWRTVRRKYTTGQRTCVCVCVCVPDLKRHEEAGVEKTRWKRTQCLHLSQNKRKKKNLVSKSKCPGAPLIGGKETNCADKRIISCRMDTKRRMDELFQQKKQQQQHTSEWQTLRHRLSAQTWRYYEVAMGNKRCFTS